MVGSFPSVQHQFQKGHKGGPGRPVGSSVRGRLRDTLDKIDANDDKGRTGAQILADLAFEKAEKGDLRFWQEIVHSIEGPIKQHIEHEGAGHTFNVMIVGDGDSDAEVLKQLEARTPATNDSSEPTVVTDERHTT